MVLTAILIQNALILALIIWLFLAPPMQRGAAIAWVSGATVFMIGLLLAGLWVYPPFWGAIVYAALLALGCARVIKRANLAERAFKMRSVILQLLLTVLGGALIWQGVAGRIEPGGDFIDLASPLPTDSRFCVLSGGASVALNLHYVEGSSTAANYEKHSVDFHHENALGFRTDPAQSWKPKPRNPRAYSIFDAPVTAPCAGKVIQSVDGKPDNLAGHIYRSRDGANLVTLQCEGADVVLAHFLKGSVLVQEGETVALGQPLGRVGNSGNTEEPHLHINAQRTLPDGTMEPVPMRFDDQYLVRGECL